MISELQRREMEAVQRRINPDKAPALHRIPPFTTAECVAASLTRSPQCLPLSVLIAHVPLKSTVIDSIQKIVTQYSSKDSSSCKAESTWS